MFINWKSSIRLTIVRKIEAGDGSYPSVNTCVHYLKVTSTFIKYNFVIYINICAISQSVSLSNLA